MLSEKAKTRITILIFLLIVAFLVIFIVLKSLEENVVYFFSPTEIYEKHNISINKKIRPIVLKVFIVIRPTVSKKTIINSNAHIVENIWIPNWSKFHTQLFPLPQQGHQAYVKGLSNLPFFLALPYFQVL